jgi:hypothetical protein
MRHVDLNQFDLNLLIALDALLTEKSVTRGCAHASQPVGDERRAGAPPPGRLSPVLIG